MVTAIKDYRAHLGVSPDASQDEIHRAYLELANRAAG